MEPTPTDVLPQKVRMWLYFIVFIALLAFGALRAADGDWAEAVYIFLTSLAPLLAGTRTTSAYTITKG